MGSVSETTACTSWWVLVNVEAIPFLESAIAARRPDGDRHNQTVSAVEKKTEKGHSSVEESLDAAEFLLLVAHQVG